MENCLSCFFVSHCWWENSLWTGSQVGYRAKTKIELREGTSKPGSARPAHRVFFSPKTALGSLFTGWCENWIELKHKRIFPFQINRQWNDRWAPEVMAVGCVQHPKVNQFRLFMLLKMRNKVESVDESLKGYHSNESYWAVLSCGAVYYAVQGDSTFWVCGWNPKEWPFKWKLLNSTFLWCCLLRCTRWFYLLSLWMKS